MAKTFIELRKQITALEKEAEKVRAKEVTGVIQRIKIAIEFYGLTAQDLFPKAGKAVAKAKPATKDNKSPARTRSRHGAGTITRPGRTVR